jgi:hypothetical protein
MTRMDGTHDFVVSILKHVPCHITKFLLRALIFQICCSEHAYEGHCHGHTSGAEAQGDNSRVC